MSGPLAGIGITDNTIAAVRVTRNSEQFGKLWDHNDVNEIFYQKKRLEIIISNLKFLINTAKRKKMSEREVSQSLKRRYSSRTFRYGYLVTT